ncbi:MAG: hypothetical protein V4437_01390 [Patescibacteria group bacterium]
MNERLLHTNAADVQALLGLDFSNPNNVQTIRKVIAGVDVASLGTTDRFKFDQIVQTVEKLIACTEGIIPRRVDSRVSSS